MPRSVPLLLFPALVSCAIAAVFCVANAEAFRAPSTERLTSLLASSPYEGERVEAIEELHSHADGVGAVEQAVRDKSPAVRLKAAIVLSLRHDPAGLEVLLSRAGDPQVGVRLLVVMSLGRLTDPRAREKLEEIAKDDPTPDVQKRARMELSQ